MFALDRETAIIVGVIACAIASYYIYTDLKKSKDDITKIKTFLDSVTSEPPPDMYMRGAPPQAVTHVQPQVVTRDVQPEIVHENSNPVPKSPE